MKKLLFLALIVILLFQSMPFANASSDLKSYYLVKDLGNDKIIVEDKWGDRYVVEYGIGCLSMWRYEGKNIFIATGTFLDGIGDTIYLLDSDQECKVWDADEIEGSYSPSYSSAYNLFLLEQLRQQAQLNSNPPSNLYSCPANSYESTSDPTKCQCAAGFQSNLTGDGCTPVPTKTNEQICKDDFGTNSYWDGTKTNAGLLNCRCKTGYTWNAAGNACVILPVKTNISDFGQTSILDSFTEEETQAQVVEVPAPSNFKLEKKKKIVLVTWQNNQAVGYEYILTKKYYERTDELEDGDGWKEIEKPSIKFKRTKVRQGRKYYLYVRAFDEEGNESSIASVDIQF